MYITDGYMDGKAVSIVEC